MPIKALRWPVMGEFFGGAALLGLSGKGFFGGTPVVLSWTSRGTTLGAPLTGVDFGNTVALSSPGVGPTAGIPVLKSIDNGLTWATRAGPVVASSSQSIAYGNGVWIVAVGAARYYRSTDDGQTWTLNTVVGLGGGCVGVATDGAGHWVLLSNAAGPNNYAVSNNQGVSFTVPATFTNKVWGNGQGFGRVITWDGGRMIATGQQTATSFPTVNVSTDLGSTWVETVIENVANAFYAGPSYDGSVYSIGRIDTNTVRSAFTPANLAGAVPVNTGLTDGGNNCVFAHASVIWSFGKTGGASRSLDHGNTWTPFILNFQPPMGGQAAFDCTFDTVNSSFIAVGNGGNVATFP